MFSSAYPDPLSQSHFYADVPVKRAVAWGIDTMLIAFAVAVIVPFTGFLALLFVGGLYMVVSFLYRWIGLARHSATIGMRIMGVEFRDRQGYRIDAMTAFAHTLGYSLSVAFVMPQLISLALMAFTPRGQSLSDHVLGTVLVNRGALY